MQPQAEWNEAVIWGLSLAGLFLGLGLGLAGRWKAAFGVIVMILGTAALTVYWIAFDYEWGSVFIVLIGFPVIFFTSGLAVGLPQGLLWRWWRKRGKRGT